MPTPSKYDSYRDAFFARSIKPEPEYDPATDHCVRVSDKEGGVWRQPTEVEKGFTAEGFNCQPLGEARSFSFIFQSGRVWDNVNGWRLDNHSSRKIVREAVQPAMARTFETGATRDVDTNKLDYEAFLSPAVLVRYAQYMHKNRMQSDGQIRDGDNWQKGIPLEVYMKSAFRHFMEVWTLHRGNRKSALEMEEAICALLFNMQGYLFEVMRLKNENRPIPQTFSGRVTD